MRPRYHRKAREELARAAEWYEERRPGLGADLLAEVKRALGILVSFPFSSPLWPLFTWRCAAASSADSLTR